MKLEITSEEKQALEKQHKQERDHRIVGRIKAVLLYAEGHFEKLKQKYPKAAKIHLALDHGRYNTRKETKEAAEKHGLVLLCLPPYSPNPIERLWKMNMRATIDFFIQHKSFARLF